MAGPLNPAARQPDEASDNRPDPGPLRLEQGENKGEAGGGSGGEAAELKRLSRNFTLDFGGRYLIFFVTGVNGILLARWLGKELLGEWGLFSALIGTGGTLASLGFHYSLPRRLARQLKAGEAAEGLLAATLRLKLLTGLGLGAGLALLSPLVVDHYEGKLSLAMALLAAFFLFANGIGSYANPLFVGAKLVRYNYQVGLPLTFLTLGLTGGFYGWALVGRGDASQEILVGYTLAFVLLNLAFGLYSVALVNRRLGRVGLRAPEGLGRQLLMEGAPFMAMALVLGLFDQLFVFVLASNQEKEIVGLFVAAFALMRLVRVVPQSFNTVMLPLIAERTATDGGATNGTNGTDGEGEGEKEALAGVYRSSQAMLALAGALVGLLLIGLAQPVVDLLLGKDFTAAGGLLRLLALAVVLRYCAQGMFPNLMSAHCERQMVAVMAVSLAVGAAVALAFSGGEGQWRGAEGAVLGYVVAESVNLALMSGLVLSRNGWLVRPLPLVASVGVVALGYLFLEPALGLAGPLAAAGLFALIAWRFLLDRTERSLIRRLWRALMGRENTIQVIDR